MDADGSAEGDHLFRHIPLSATSSATTSTFKDSDFLIPGTLVAFTSGLPLCTTMRGKLLPRNYSGHRYWVAAGGLTGRAPTVACDNVRARFPQLFAHLPAADCSFGVLRDRRATCRRVSVLAAPNRAAIDSNAGVVPFQGSWSTSSKSSISVRSVASFGKSIALSQSQQSVSARALALAAFTRHSRQSLGMDSSQRQII